LEARFAVQSSEKKTEPLNPDQDIRFVLARAAAKLNNEPVYALLALPKGDIEIPQIFEDERSSVVRLIEKPPELRAGGFDLDLGANSRIERGELRRVVLPEYGVLDVYKDGSVFYISTAGQEGLAWGRRERQEREKAILINQLVLIEKVILFFLFLRELYDGKGDFKATVSFCIYGEQSDNHPIMLEAGALSEWPGRTKEAPAKQKVFSIDISRADLMGPSKAAARLVQQIYNWFSFDNGAIPYLVDNSVGQGFDLEAIRRGGR
jgi:hypothetical protein